MVAAGTDRRRLPRRKLNREAETIGHPAKGEPTPYRLPRNGIGSPIRLFDSAPGRSEDAGDGCGTAESPCLRGRSARSVRWLLAAAPPAAGRRPSQRPAKRPIVALPVVGADPHFTQVPRHIGGDLQITVQLARRRAGWGAVSAASHAARAGSAVAIGQGQQKRAPGRRVGKRVPRSGTPPSPGYRPGGNLRGSAHGRPRSSSWSVPCLRVRGSGPVPLRLPPPLAGDNSGQFMPRPTGSAGTQIPLSSWQRALKATLGLLLRSWRRSGRGTGRRVRSA